MVSDKLETNLFPRALNDGAVYFFYLTIPTAKFENYHARFFYYFKNDAWRYQSISKRTINVSMFIKYESLGNNIIIIVL